MDVKKCKKCGKGVLIKVQIPASMIRVDAKATDTDKTAWRCTVCSQWTFE